MTERYQQGVNNDWKNQKTFDFYMLRDNGKICLDEFVYYVFLYLCFSLCHINVMVQCWVDKHVSFRIQIVKGFVPLFVHLP